MNNNYDVIGSENIFEDRFTSVDKLNIVLPNGKATDRVIIGRASAAAVIAINGQNEILMVKQFRFGLNKTFLEIPAGMLDDNEEPEKCALRELEEETGYKAGDIRHLITMDPAPSFCNERVYIYIATNLTKGVLSLDEDEFIICESIKICDVLNMIDSGQITDAKTIVGVLAAHRFLKGED